MRRRRSLPGWLPALLALLVAVKGHVAHSEAGDPPPLDRPLRFQWLFVPKSEKELSKELRRRNLAVAVPRSEFEKHVAALAPPSSTKDAAHAHISRAVYRARLQGSQLADGRALLHVSHTGDGVASMSLGECSLALRDAQWRLDTPMPAVLASTEDGRQVARVERSAPLAVNWSLRGVSDPFGEVTFSAKLPPSAASRLELEIPLGLRLETQQGVALRGADVPAGGGRKAASLWTVELGATRDVSLRILPDEAYRRQSALLRQKLTYDLSPSQGTLTGSLLLDALQDPLRRLDLELSADLDLLRVRLGDQQLPLTGEPSEIADAPRRVTVHFPEPLVGTERELRFEAVFPIESERRWPLPKIVARNVAWQEGVATLRVREPLRLNQLQTHRCRQISSSSLPAPSAGQSLEVQLFSPDAAIELLLAPPSPRIEVKTGTTLEVDSVSIAAEVVAEVQALEGRTYGLEMSLPAAWTVESLRTEPSDALDDYDVLPRGRQAQQVRLRLHLGVSEEDAAPLRILLKAHRRLPALEATLAIDELRLAEFTGVEVGRRLISVPAAQFQLQRDMYVERLDPLALPEGDQRLATGGADRIVLVDDRRADSLRLTLISERPRYTTDVEMTAHLDAAALLESYRLLVRPQSSPVGRLLVHFSKGREETLQWSLSGESNLAILAQKVSFDDEPMSRGAEGETWEITLQRPRGVPFELRAVRRSGGKGTRQISLLSVPQADSQTGIVSIESAGGAALDISSDGLRAIPADLRSGERLSSTRAVFRYEPSQDASLQVTPASPTDSQPSLWAWGCRLTTYCGVDGAIHKARYYLETTGQRQLDVELPSGCDIRQVLVDGRDMRAATLDDERRFSISLPSQQRYPLLDIEYRERDATLPLLFGNLHARLPKITGLPVVHRQWIVWAPPGYQVGPPPQETEGRSAGDRIGRRLFGPFWRDGDRPFELLSETDWTNLARTAAPTTRAEQTARRCLESLGSLLNSADRTSQSLTWSRLISTYDQGLPAEQGETARTALRLDAVALAAVGIGPQSPAPPPPAPVNPVASAVWLLESSNLVLLAAEEELLLTTRAAAGRIPLEQSRQHFGGAVVVGRFSDGRSTLAPLGRYPTPKVWAASSLGQLSPWMSDQSQSFAALSDNGWTAYHLELPHDAAPMCTVSRFPLIEAIGWAMILLSAACAFSLARSRPARLALLIGLTAVVALLTPATFTPWATGVFLGVLLACMLAAALALRPLPPAPRSETSSSHGSAGNEASALHRVALLALIAAGTAATVQVSPLATITRADDNLAESIAGNSAGKAASKDDVNGGAADSTAAAAGDVQGGGTAEVSQPTTLYSVVVEVDEQGKPADKYVWVPAPLWIAMRRRVQHMEQPWHSVLLHNAQYQCRMSWRSDETLAADELVATYEFEVVGTPTSLSRYTVPIDCRRLDLLVDGALLDGRPAAVDFDDDGARLSVVVDQSGKHTLELRFHPRHVVEGEIATLDVGVAPVVGAQLRVRFPGDVSGIEVPQALGATLFDPVTGEMVTDLGPADRLKLLWSPDGRLENETGRLDVEEMTWLKVRPGAVGVDVHYRFHRDTPIDEIRLLAEPGLRLRPIGADQPVRQWHMHEGETKILHFELEQPWQKDVTLHLRFLRTGTSGIGNLHLPRLRVVADQVLSRRFAVSVSPLLDFQQSGRHADYDAEAFVAQWGAAVDSQPPPDLTFTIAEDEESSWTLATRPKSPTNRYTSTTDVHFGEDFAELVFHADIDTDNGYLFQHRLLTPPEMAVEKVSLLVEDKQAVARWSRDDDGVLTMMLNRRVTGRQELSISGRIPVARRRSALPQVTLSEAQAESSRYRIYRSPAVRVSVIRTNGLVEREPDSLQQWIAPEQKTPSQRLVAAFEHQSPAEMNATENTEATKSPAKKAGAAAQSGKSPAAADGAEIECLLDIVPNRPTTKYRSVTTMRRNDGKWTIEAACQLHVTGGLLDEFWLDVPDRLIEPFEIEPGMDFEVTSVPGQARRRVVIRPAEPISGDAGLTLRASLSPSLAGERIAFPDIRPLAAEPIEQFVIVPTEDEQQRYVWETSGLQAAELPEVMDDADASASDGSKQPVAEKPAENAGNADEVDGRAVWRVVASRYSASLKLLERSAAVPPQVHLADIQFAWELDGSCRGLATFDLEPAGRESCVLVLPSPYRLVQASVAGLPARLNKLAEKRWRLMLGPAQLPQRIVVLFEGQLPPAAGRRRVIAAPRLENISTLRTLWTLHAPPQGGSVRAVDDAAISTPADLMGYRFAATASLIDRASDVALEQPRFDVDRWYLPWARRLVSAREGWSGYVDSLELQDSDLRVKSQEIEAIDRRQNEDAQRLDVTHIRSLAAASLGPGEVWEVAQQGRAPSLYCSLAGGGGERLEVVVARPPASDLGLRLLLAAMAAVAATVLFLLVSRGPLGTWIVRWPHAVGVLVGLAWWLWLTPSLLGWAIVLASVVTALRMPWRPSRRPSPGHASTIIRRNSA